MANLDRALDRKGSELRYADTGGRRAPVVFTHGAGVDHRMFDAQAEALRSAGHRVVLWDLRGHGASTLAPGVRFDAASALDDLVALLDHLALERPVLVGHSLVWRATAALVAPEPGYRTPVPLGLVRGERDRTGNIATAMPRWAAAERVAEQVIPDAGHVVTLDAPEATTRALVAILDGWARSSGADGER